MSDSNEKNPATLDTAIVEPEALKPERSELIKPESVQPEIKFEPIDPEMRSASMEDLLNMQRLLAREILIFLAFLLLSMGAILFAFDRIFQWSHTDNIRTAVIPVSAYTYAVFMLIWLQRTLVSAGSLLKIDDQLERIRPKHRRFLSRFKADESDPPLEYLMMFMFSFLLTASSMVAAYIALNSKRFRLRFDPIMDVAAQGRKIQFVGVILTFLVAVPIFWWGWNMMRSWAKERYRVRPPEPEVLEVPKPEEPKKLGPTPW